MELRLAVLLGVLQGVLEWLPVSSEGMTALVLTGTGVATGEAVGVALWLHVGTLGAAVVYLRDDLVRILRRAGEAATPERRLLVFLVVATFCTGLVGGPLLLLGVTDLALSPALATLLIGVLLLLTAAVLAWQSPGAREMEAASTRDAVVPGLVQGLAALPGLSRSGLTMAALFAERFDAEAALRLSFLMSIPAVAGAQVALALLDPVAASPAMLVATATAFVVGLATIDALLRLARRVRFDLVVAVLAAVALAAGAALLVA